MDLDINLNQSRKNNKNEYVINYVSEYGQLQMLKYLFERGININKECKSNKTPLLISIEKGHFHIVRFLVENGAILNISGKSNPLKVSIENKRRDITRYLIKKGSNVNFYWSESGSRKKDQKNYYIFDIIIKKKDINFIKLFIKKGANLNEERINEILKIKKIDITLLIFIKKILIEKNINNFYKKIQKILYKKSKIFSYKLVLISGITDLKIINIILNYLFSI